MKSFNNDELPIFIINEGKKLKKKEVAKLRLKNKHTVR